jgi:hypothetical protein
VVIPPALWWSTIFSGNRYPPAELRCSLVLPLSLAQFGNIRLARSGVPEFWHFYLDADQKHPIWVVKPEGKLFSGSCPRMLFIPVRPGRRRLSFDVGRLVGGVLKLGA